MYCHLLMTFANSLDPDQAWQNDKPDLDQNCLLHSDGFSERFFGKSYNWKKISKQHKLLKLPSMQRVKFLKVYISDLCQSSKSRVFNREFWRFVPYYAINLAALFFLTINRFINSTENNIKDKNDKLEGIGLSY